MSYNPSCCVSTTTSFFSPRFPHAMCSPSSCFSSPVPFSALALSSALTPFFHFPPFQVTFPSFISLFFFQCPGGFPSFFRSSFVDFSALLWCLLILICTLIFSPCPTSLECFSFLHFAAFTRLLPFLLLFLFFPYSNCRPRRPLSDNASNFSPDIIFWATWPLKIGPICRPESSYPATNLRCLVFKRKKGFSSTLFLRIMKFSQLCK